MLTEEAFEAAGGEGRTLAFATRRAVVDEARLEERFEHVAAKAPLHHPVPKCQRLDVAELGVVYRKRMVGRNAVRLRDELLVEAPEVFGKVDLEADNLLTRALASGGGAVGRIEVLEARHRLERSHVVSFLLECRRVRRRAMRACLAMARSGPHRIRAKAEGVRARRRHVFACNLEPQVGMGFLRPSTRGAKAPRTGHTRLDATSGFGAMRGARRSCCSRCSCCGRRSG